MNTNCPTCLIYGRCSTKDQEVKNQTNQLLEYANKQGWTVLEPVIDICSGGKGIAERAGLDKVFRLAHQKKFDILLFWSLDRLSREGSRKTIEYLTRLDNAGVKWHSFTEQYLSSLGIFADCIISLLSTLAKQERIRISERTKAGLERTVRINGTVLGRKRTPAHRIEEARSLRGQGLSFTAIGAKLGVTRIRAFQMCQGQQLSA